MTDVVSLDICLLAYHLSTFHTYFNEFLLETYNSQGYRLSIAYDRKNIAREQKSRSNKFNPCTNLGLWWRFTHGKMWSNTEEEGSNDISIQELDRLK